MKESTLQKNSDTRVIVPAKSGLYTFVQPIGLELGRKVHDAVEMRISESYPQYKWLQNDVCYRGVGEDGLRGSSFELNVLRNAELRELGLRIGRPLEMKAICRLGMLPNGIYTEFGGVCYTEKGINSDIAEKVAEEAKKRGLKLPVIASYNAFGHRKGKNGFEVYFVDDKDGVNLDEEIFSGDEAREVLRDNFDLRGEKGFRWLFRDWFGGWYADWGNRVSSAYGRVGFVFGEAAQKSLEEIKEEELKRKYDDVKLGLEEKKRDLDVKMVKLDNERGKELKIFSKVFKR